MTPLDLQQAVSDGERVKSIRHERIAAFLQKGQFVACRGLVWADIWNFKRLPHHAVQQQGIGVVVG